MVQNPLRHWRINDKRFKDPLGVDALMPDSDVLSITANTFATPISDFPLIPVYLLS
jgi:hypothetical protein